MPRIRRAAAGLGLLLVVSCGIDRKIEGLFRSDSPYEEYSHALHSAGLDSTGLGRDWIAAGERALASPVTARLPFRETGYFAPEQPAAVVYRLELRRGRRLAIDVSWDTAQPARLFVDLFRVRDGDSPERVSSLPADSSSLRWTVRRDGTYLLRLQPELLRGGRWTVTERTLASFGFPLPGFGVPAVKSRFGVDREAGRRRHEGIDIFAPRGTPMVAVVDGYARSGTNELGGNVVWLQDAGEGRALYYAHLERWAPASDGYVRIGDTLGFVGNTGNARTTPPHLHFGIYQQGAVDPLPFVLPDDPAPPLVGAPVDRVGQWVRITARTVVVRAGPHPEADTVGRLERGAVARVTAASLGAFRVALPDASEVYVEATAVARAADGARPSRLEAGAVVRESPDSTAPAVEVLSAATDVGILGRFGEFELVRLPDARLAWWRSPNTPTR